MTPMSRRVMNLAHALTQAAARYPERDAIVWGEARWTWAALDARVSALAAGLSARGVRKGDRLLVHARNGNAILEIMYAAFRLGAVFVPTNHRLMPDDVVFLAAQSGATVMLCNADYAAHVAAVRAGAPAVGHVVAIGDGPAEGEPYEALVAEGMGRAVADAAVEHDDPCWFFYTSGTTGKPKAAVLTHGQMAFVITNHLCDLMPGTTAEGDASLVVAPLSHGAGVHAVAQVTRAVTSVLPAGDRFDAAEVWALVARHRITNLFTVPTILKMMVEHPAAGAHDHASLRHVIYAGAPMYREDQKRALRTLGRVIVQYFGLGEVTGNITVLPPALHEPEDGPGVRIGTCGFERTGMQVQIQDADGREVGPGETGEICVCGPAVFAGYWDNPKANADAFRDGWFRTGDLGYLDAQRFLFITGRASDMYISGGSNIYPREIEEKILTHPAVAETAVLGVPDPTWGEIGIAVCVPREGERLTEEDVLAFLFDKVARYKLPKRVILRESLPKSGYGKITKKMVREELEAAGLLGGRATDAP
ncbi:Long-chain-fatty-acid--CoA ligase FadD13 [Methylobacterium crusticola]|uniref:Long-chain-fatty-acid--CoA ligase FadD13 n=1 Tax=Methylobacterium crusticola TaxID=1697972 RepID=A0ABQ4QYU9_9HYPH|nr:acyl-CoA synthetase [Methylobacterium crusticola]GJD50357.1 Long-chain-fatty-acid--CoA ligase FadD13 [Methylobacterium crusticola]